MGKLSGRLSYASIGSTRWGVLHVLPAVPSCVSNMSTDFFAPVATAALRSCCRALGRDWLIVGFEMRRFLPLAPLVHIRLFLLCKTCLGLRCGQVPIVTVWIVAVLLRTLDERFDVQVTIDNGFLEVT